MFNNQKKCPYTANAPMCFDFGSSPNISSDYFDVPHPENETPFADAPDKLRSKSNDCNDSLIFLNEGSKANTTKTSQLTTNFIDTLDTINMTPVKIVSPKSKDGQLKVLKETTVGAVLNDVITIASSAIKQNHKAVNLNKTQATDLSSKNTPGKPKRATRSMYSVEAKKTPSANRVIPNLRKSTLLQRATPVKSSASEDTAKNEAGVPRSKIIRTPILKLTKIDPPNEEVDAAIEPAYDNEDHDLGNDETMKPEALEMALEPMNPLPLESHAKLIASTPAARQIHSIKPVNPIPMAPSTAAAPEEVPTPEAATARDHEEFSPIDAENPEDRDEDYDEVFENVEDFEHYRVHKVHHIEKRKTHQQPSVLTSHARRRSSLLMKNRRNSNRYVSLAEAIVKFQRSTPTRFRSISAKNPKPKALQAVKQTAKRPLIPVSPALSSKNRVRRHAVLSRAELEEIEVQKMKQYQIRANPVPKSILQAPQPLKAVPKKPLTSQKPFHLGIPKKNVTNKQPVPSSSSTHEQYSIAKKPSKVTVPTVVSTENGVAISESQIMHFGIPVVQNEIVSRKKKTTQPSPFNFEQRNKYFLDKKEEKLKKLQNKEELKGKAEFHARPMPLSSKKVPKKELPKTKEQDDQKGKQEIHKPKVIPFSFEERNKIMLKKKEELRKKIEEEEKKARVFHANPVPQFKPVMVKGVSRENLKTDEKNPAPTVSRARSRENIKADGKNSIPVVSRARSRENVKGDGKNPPTIRNRSAEPFKAPLRPTTRGLSAENLRIPRANSRDNIKGAKTPRKISASDLSDTDGNDENKAPNVPENQKPRCTSVSSLTQNMPVLKPKLKTLPVELHSDKRAQIRRQFDELVKMKNAVGEEKKRREQEEKMAREQAEINEMRKKAEIKARPMPVYKPVVIVKSTKPLTAPESPAWSHKR